MKTLVIVFIVLTMIAIISENIVAEDRNQEYLDIVADLLPELEKIEGFISVERFQSAANPQKVLSLSFWKDEESIRVFRNLEAHREAEDRYLYSDTILNLIIRS